MCLRRMKTHSRRHPLSKKNPGRDRRKPQKPEIRLGRCRNWLKTLENPADRWWSVCAEKRVRRWLVIALAVQNPTVRAQTATHEGETKAGAAMREQRGYFCFSDSDIHFDAFARWFISLHSTPAFFKSCMWLFISSVWTGDWRLVGGSLDQLTRGRAGCRLYPYLQPGQELCYLSV